MATPLTFFHRHLPFSFFLGAFFPFSRSFLIIFSPGLLGRSVRSRTTPKLPLPFYLPPWFFSFPPLPFLSFRSKLVRPSPSPFLTRLRRCDTYTAVSPSLSWYWQLKRDGNPTRRVPSPSRQVASRRLYTASFISSLLRGLPSLEHANRLRRLWLYEDAPPLIPPKTPLLWVFLTRIFSSYSRDPFSLLLYVLW